MAMTPGLGPYSLRDYQQVGVRFIMSRKYALLADFPGAGKTIQSLEAALQMGVKRLIIVCPGFLCSQWKQETDKYYAPLNIQSFILPCSVVHLPTDFLDKFVLILSYDTAWRKMPLLAKGEYDFAILDESHFLKNRSAKRTRIILGKGSFLANTKRCLLMTGTPMLNKPIDLYEILRNFVPEVLKQYIAYPLFVSRFCGFMMKGSKNEGQLSDMLRSFMLRRTLEEVAPELPDIVLTKVPFPGVEIPKEFEGELTPIQRREVAIAKLPLTIDYIQGLLQITSKILVIAYHKDTINKLTEKFSKNKAVAIHGGLSEKERLSRLQQFITGDSDLLIAQISTIGVGVDGLQKVSNRIIFAESDWSPAVIQQAIARLRRIGQKEKTVFVDFLICTGTIEDDIDFSLLAKEEMIDAIVGKDYTPEDLKDENNMPHGYSHHEWSKLSNKSQVAISTHNTKPHDHGKQANTPRYYEQVHSKRMETLQMAKPQKTVDVDSQAADSTSTTKRASELLSKALTTFVSALVHDIMNGGVPESFVGPATPVQIYGNVIPTEERTIPALPEPVVIYPTVEEVKAQATAFLTSLKQAGLTDAQALAHFKGLEAHPGKRMDETSGEERAKLINFLAAIDNRYFVTVAEELAPKVSTDEI